MIKRATPFWLQIIWLQIMMMLLISGVALAQSREWPQWGGPNRNFQIGRRRARPLVARRRAEAIVGPVPLGEGYSGISASDGRLYTMYRAGDREVVIAIEAATGKDRFGSILTKRLSQKITICRTAPARMPPR